VGRSLAIQFHPEVDPTTIERWLVGHAHELASRGHDVGALRAQSARLGAASAAAGRLVLEAFLERSL
jgi:GMP synthase (glutamine-hydrolysing)